MKKLLLILLFFPVQIFAQGNCTTQPAMNTMTIAPVVGTTGGISGCTTCGVAGTITVNLTGMWTSQTGWATVYPTAGPSLTNPANAGTFKILSGNGTMQLTLDASPAGLAPPAPAVSSSPPIGTVPSRTNFGVTVNGVTAGNYVSDLGVIRNSARNYTIVWSTPGFNSDTWISYGDDEDTVTVGASGFQWRHQDETTGVTNHSITIDRLDTATSSPVGQYFFTVWSNCFKSNGTPDVSLSTRLPQNPTLGPNAGRDPGGFQKIVTTYPDSPVNGYPFEDIFTIGGYEGYPTWSQFIPQQDGVHTGFRVSPGGTRYFNGGFIDNVTPAQPIVGDNWVNFNVDDWVGPAMGGFFATYGKSGTAAGAAWTGQAILVRSSGGGITINIPTNAADGRNPAACTAVAGAQLMTLDDGTPACAFPFKVTATRYHSNASYHCGTTITCGPPGTPSTPIVNLPYTAESWVIVFTPTPVRQGTVGPWISQYTGQPGVPCELHKNINIEKPNPAYTNPGCRHYEQGLVFGPNGNLFSYQGNAPAPDGSGTPPFNGQESNCAWNGLRNENTFIASSQPTWFYDGAYVCHRLDLQYANPHGSNDEYEKHILGIQMEQAGWPRTNDAGLFGDFKVSAAYTINLNPLCNVVDPTENPMCSTMTIPVTGNLAPLAAGLAAGVKYRICINQTGAYNYGCFVFPYTTPAQANLASLAMGGNLPAESVQMLILYTTTNNDIYSIAPSGNTGVTRATDATCPTSGNCSITVTSPPAMPNAAGYDVFARVGTGTYYRQNTGGPVLIGTVFTFGTTANPLLTSGYALPTGTWTANAGNVVAVDATNNTITTDIADGPLPSVANNANIIIIRQLAGIIADAGTTSTSIVCNSCNFSWNGNATSTTVGQSNGVHTSSVAYCGVTTGDAGAPLYSLAPNRGSQITAVTATTVTLQTAINCAPGTNFEIRRPGTLPAAVNIFNWSNSPYDAWKRLGNYMGADMVLWFVSSVLNPIPGSSTSCCNNGAVVSRRREVSLSFLACHRAIQIANDLTMLGSSTAWQGSVISPCTSASAASNPPRWQSLFSMIDLMTNNNYGRGNNIGSFLDGLVGYVLIDWWSDPLMGVQNNPQFLYWVKRLTDNLWTYYNANSTYLTTCPPHWPHEWTYTMDEQIIGVCGSSNLGFTILNPDGTTNPVNDYWSIYGNLIPMFAFFYQYTGNATISTVNAPPPWPSCCINNPPPTYGAAYIDMASWIFVHMGSTSSFLAPGAGAKTLGEMGLWQDQAIAWMRGTSTAPPPTQQYPNFRPPIISELHEPLFLASMEN